MDVGHRRLRRGLIAACALAAALFPALSPAVIWETYRAKVIHVGDGDSIVVLRDKKEIKVRLNGVDAPEAGQAFGKRARKWTTDACAQKTVTVRETDLDQYGRTVAEITLPDGTSLNREIVRAGYAWWFRKYSDDQTLKDLEAEARAAKRGLWLDKTPIPPWEYRQAQYKGAATPR